MTQLTLKIFVHEGGKLPQKGKEGDAGIDVFANLTLEVAGLGAYDFFPVNQFESVKIPLGFSYAFWTEETVPGEDGYLYVKNVVSHDYFLDIRNRSGVGTKSGFVTVAEIGDANYRGIIHYCVAKVTEGCYVINHGDKIAQAIINPFVDPHKVIIEQVNSIEELGPSVRGATGFGSSGA